METEIVRALGLIAIMIIEEWQAPLLDVERQLRSWLARDQNRRVRALEPAFAGWSPGGKCPDRHVLHRETGGADGADHQIVCLRGTDRDQRRAGL